MKFSSDLLRSQERQIEQCTLAVPEIDRWRQEDRKASLSYIELEASLGFMRPYLKKEKYLSNLE